MTLDIFFLWVCWPRWFWISMLILNLFICNDYLYCIPYWYIYAPLKKSMQIHLDKKVPTGAGLGGGSSNAATALWAANQFNNCIAAEKELKEWSSEIGSDVPFFFSQGAAYCTGRGEVCLYLTILSSKILVSLFIWFLFKDIRHFHFAFNVFIFLCNSARWHWDKINNLLTVWNQ